MPFTRPVLQPSSRAFSSLSSSLLVTVTEHYRIKIQNRVLSLCFHISRIFYLVFQSCQDLSDSARNSCRWKTRIKTRSHCDGILVFHDKHFYQTERCIWTPCYIIDVTSLMKYNILTGFSNLK